MFAPVIVPPTSANPFGIAAKELNWHGTYNSGTSSSGKTVRKLHFLQSSSKVTDTQREIDFNKFLIRRYQDWY